MARHPVGLLPRLALACPICATPDGALMGAGARAGASVLILVTLAVLAVMAVFAVRLWRAEARDEREARAAEQ